MFLGSRWFSCWLIICSLVVVLSITVQDMASPLSAFLIYSPLGLLLANIIQSGVRSVSNVLYMTSPLATVVAS